MGCRRAVGCRRCGGVAVRRPSGSRVSRQPPSWTARWWARHTRARLARSVGPPWSQWRRWWASHQARGPVAVGQDTAAVADGQGGALGGLDDPAGPADLQRLGGRTPEDRGEQGRRGPQPGRQPVGPRSPAAGVPAGGWIGCPVSGRGLLVVLGAGVVAGVVLARVWRVTRTRVTAPSQASRWQASGSSGPGPADLPTQPHRAAEEAVQVHGDRQLGADPTGLGEPAALQAAAGQLGQGIGAALAAAAGVLGVGGAGQRLQRGQQGLAGLGLQQPVDGDHALPGRGQPQPSPLLAPLGQRSAPSGSATSRRWPRTRRSRGGSSRRAASTSTGSASAVTWSGRSWVPWASTWAWATEMRPVGQGLGGGGQRAAEQGPGGPDTPRGGAGTHAQPAPQPAAVEPTCWPCRPRRRPRASTAASSLSQWPSRRSTSPRSTRTRSARTRRPGRPGPGRPARPRPRRVPPAVPGRRPSCRVECCVRVHSGNLSTPTPNASTKHHDLGTTSLPPGPGTPSGGGTGPQRAGARLSTGNRSVKNSLVHWCDAIPDSYADT